MNDDISVHSNGATTTIDQKIRTKCEAIVTARSPPDAGGVVTRHGGRLAPRRLTATSVMPARSGHVAHAQLDPLFAAGTRLTVNTMAANSRVTIASTTPMALALPALPSTNAVLNSSWVITRVE